MSLTKVSYSMIQGGPVSVMDFGATGDGTTDDTAAIQAAVDYVCDNNISMLFFPFGQGQRYKLTSTVTVPRPNVSFMGDAGLSWTADNSGFIFSNVADLVFFDFSNTGYGAYGCYHMAFLGNGYPYSGSINNTQTALKFSDTGNGPSRPLPVRDSWFLGFNKAISLDNDVVTDTITPSWIDVQDCFFVNGTYAVYGNPDIPTLGLRFVNNVSEQGARLYGNFSSHCEVTNNLIEGQTNFLTITGNGGTHLLMRDNYLEINEGNYIASAALSNSSNCVWEFDYFYTFRGDPFDDFVVGGGALVCKGNVQSSQVLVRGGLQANSVNVKNYKAFQTDTPSSVLKANNFVGDGTAATFRTANMGGAVTVQAPHGQVTTAIQLTAAGFTGFTDITTTYSVDDFVTITYLVRALDVTVPTDWGGFLIQALNGSSSAVVAANVDQYFTYNLNQEWMLVTMTMQAENAGTVLKVRCNPYYLATVSGAGMQIAGLSVNIVTSPPNRILVTPLYPVI
jgi:hypothetical protein